jgi:hypothetical protein
MIETLEVEAPDDKRIEVVMMPKEDIEDWISCRDSPLISFSKQFTDFILSIIENMKPNFVSIESCNLNYKNFEGDHLYDALKSENVDFTLVAIPEGVSSYLQAQIAPKKEIIKHIRSELAKTKTENPEQMPSFHIQNLVTWGSMLEDEIEEEENKVGGPVKDAWIAKGILDKARGTEGARILVLHLGNESRLANLCEFFLELGVQAELIWPKKEFKVQLKPNLRWSQLRS